MISEEDAIRITRKYIEGQFPKVCSNCKRHFETLADYLRATMHVGEPVSHIDGRGGFEPNSRVDIYSYANCICGTTLTITSAQMEPDVLWQLLDWSWRECRRRGITWGQLLSRVREEIDRRVLSDDEASGYG